MCNFCGHVVTSDDLKGKEAIEACRELRDAVVSCCPGLPAASQTNTHCACVRLLQPFLFDGLGHCAQVEYVEPIPGAMRGAELVGNTHIFVIDTTIRQRDLLEMQTAMVSAMQAMCANDHVGLVAFDAVVKVFDFSKEDCACAHILPGISSPSQLDLNTLGASGAVVTAPVHACASTLLAIVKSLKPPARQPSRAKGKLRCVGPAVETAIAIAAASSRKAAPSPLGTQGSSAPAATDRVIVLLGGPATCGPGVAEAGEEEEDKEGVTEVVEEDEATQYYATVGLRSRMLGVAVDVFAVSSLGVGVRRLQALTSGDPAPFPQSHLPPHPTSFCSFINAPSLPPPPRLLFVCLSPSSSLCMSRYLSPASSLSIARARALSRTRSRSRNLYCTVYCTARSFDCTLS